MTINPETILEELKVNKLPSLPHILVEMLTACQSSTANFQQISDIISRDAAITARVISLANSSFYSRSSEINSLDRALLVLGTEAIKTIVITASVQQFFSGFNTSHTQYLKQFWKRSLACALLAKALATLTSYPYPEQAYLTGLLHNIGELVLETNHPEDYAEMHQDYDQYSNQNERENELFLTNHSDVGAWLADEWSLGEFAADAVRFHHAPLKSVLDAHHLVKLIFLSSQLSKEDALNDPASFEIAEGMFDLSAALTREIVIQIQNEVVEIANSLNIPINKDSDKEAETDKVKQAELADQIKNISLLQTANKHLSQSDSLPQLFRGIQESTELLFGYRNTKVLLIDEFDENLKYHTLNETEHNLTDAELTIPLLAERSLIARSVLDRKILCASNQKLFTDGLPVIDQHFIRLTGGEDFVCVPMICNDKIIGALIMGAFSETHIPPATLQLLDYFASEAANACIQVVNKHKTPETNHADQEIQLKVREIAHEASNPLSIIRNYLETLATKLGEDHDAQPEINILREEIDRTGQIILRLRDLHQDQQEHEPGVDINREISDLTKLFEGSLFLSHGVDCELKLDKKLERQKGNRNYLRQVLTNLIKNATEAMDNGGTIKIKTSHNVNVNGRRFVEIVVSDQGKGIPDSVLSHLFQPVTTTKGNGHSGLGLSISKNLINNMSGTISCRSSDKGSEMQVLIPEKKIE